MSRMLSTFWVGVLFGCLGCGPQAAGDDSENECAPVDPEAVFTARFEPCVDSACERTDPDYWYPPYTEEDVVDTTLRLTCVVQTAEAFGETGRRFVLTDCSGDGAPDSQSVVVELEAPALPRLEADDSVLLHVHRRHAAWSYAEHRSWALRESTNELLALVSADNHLPSASMTEPLAVRADPQACVGPAAGGGLIGPMEVEVSLDGDSVVVPSGNMAVLGGYLVVHERSEYAADMRGAYGGWERLEWLVVREPSS